MEFNEALLALATKLAGLAEGLGNGNSSAEEQATRLAEEAKKLIATHPSAAQPDAGDAPTWHCTNCRSRFKATNDDWQRGFGRLAPTCPNCKAVSQYTYPIGAAGLAEKIARMGYECKAGPLVNCTDWQKLTAALAGPQS